MKKGAFGRLGWLVVIGVAACAVVAAIAFGASQKSGGAKMTAGPSITVALGDGVPFEVLSAQIGVGAAVKAGRTSVSVAEPVFSEFVLSKSADADSVLLLDKLVSKTAYPAAVVTFRWGTGVTWKYDLTTVYVTAFSQSSGGDRPSESVSLNYRTLKWTFTDAAGTVTSGP